MAVVTAVIGIVSTLGFIAHKYTLTTTETYDLWDAKCPFGYYWTDVEGGGFLFISIDSELSESYVLKYEVSDELRTLIVPSTAPEVHVHLTNDSSAMWMTVTWYYWHDEPPHWDTDDSEENIVELHIYVPDPKVMG
jgi:hypothetical protein